MTVKEFLRSDKKMAIHCPTSEQAITLLILFDSLGATWYNETKYTQWNAWHRYEKQTCYNNRGGYSDLSWYLHNNVQILEFSDLEDFQKRITITQYGPKVVAKLDDKVGVAKCHPDDPFDFETGSKLALNRLFEKLSAGSSSKKTEPKLIPHLKSLDGRLFGNIGEKTDLADNNGTPLYVGDVVSYRPTHFPYYNFGPHFVCKDKDCYFIFGIKGATKLNNQFYDFAITKSKSFTELTPEDTLDEIKPVLGGNNVKR